MKFVLTTLVSALIIASVAEIGKRSSLMAAILIALPVTSLLALIFLYLETGEVAKISALSMGIFWLVLPTLLFFLMLPALLRLGLGFWMALPASAAAMVGVFWAYSWMLGKFGIKI